MSRSVETLKDAVLAEAAADILTLKETVLEIAPLVEQLKAQLPTHFDLLRAGLIETLEDIDKGIKEAADEQVKFTKGQLSVYIEQAFEKAISAESDKIHKLVDLFEKQHGAATKALKSQYDEVSTAMDEMLKIAEQRKIPKWIKIGGPIVLVVVVLCTGILSWNIGAYKEKMYSDQFQSQLSQIKTKRK